MKTYLQVKTQPSSVTSYKTLPTTYTNLKKTNLILNPEINI